VVVDGFCASLTTELQSVPAHKHRASEPPRWILIVVLHVVTSWNRLIVFCSGRTVGAVVVKQFSRIQL